MILPLGVLTNAGAQITFTSSTLTTNSTAPGTSITITTTSRSWIRSRRYDCSRISNHADKFNYK